MQKFVEVGVFLSHFGDFYPVLFSDEKCIIVVSQVLGFVIISVVLVKIIRRCIEKNFVKSDSPSWKKCHRVVKLMLNFRDTLGHSSYVLRRSTLDFRVERVGFLKRDLDLIRLKFLEVSFMVVSGIDLSSHDKVNLSNHTLA